MATGVEYAKIRNFRLNEGNSKDQSETIWAFTGQLTADTAGKSDERKVS